MKQSTYCLISSIEERDPLWPTLYSIKSKLKSYNIPHSLPKLNWHLTHVTPFKATASEVSWFALGLEIGKALSPTKHRERFIKGLTFDFYENEEEDALILRLETNEEFRNAISYARACVEKITEVKYPPKSFEANFHVTIAEGKELRKHIEQCKEVSDFLTRITKKEGESFLTTRLQFPSIFLKEKDYWVPIVL